MTSSPSEPPVPSGRRWEPSFRARLVAGVCGLVLLTGAIVLWLAHRSARAGTEKLTASVFREVSGRAATHTRAFVLRAAPVVESLAHLADKGLAIDDPDRLARSIRDSCGADHGGSEHERSGRRCTHRFHGDAGATRGRCAGGLRRRDYTRNHPE